MLAPIQFGLKNIRQFKISILGLLAVTLIPVGFLFFYLFQLAPSGTGQRMWSNFLEKGIAKQVEITISLLFLLLIGPLTIYSYRLLQQFRLYLDDEKVRLESNVPLVGKLIDWSFPLADFNDGKVKFTVLRLVARGSLPLIAFSWRNFWRRRTVSVGAWEPLDSQGLPLKSMSESSSFFKLPEGFLNWPRRASPDELQKQFESIPLIEALSQRGVKIPPLSALNRQAFGTDLFRNRRLKYGVYAMLGVSFAATATHFFAAHDYLIGQPSWLQITVFSLTCAVVVCAWLCQGKLDLSLKRSQRYEFLGAQVFVSLVMAVLLTWLAHVMTLGNTRINQAAVNASFILDIDKYQLQPSEQAIAAHPGLEPIKLDFGKEYWNALPKDSIVSISVRRNFWLRCWQYDREPILELMREFYLKR
jgi:hypothetical protein